MTRAGSKLILRTSPAPGHYLCIKWDFASLPLRAAALRISHASPMTNKTIATDAHSNVHCGAGVQRLVAKALDVERETALVVGSENVLLGICCLTVTNSASANVRLNGGLSQWFVSQFGKIDGHI